MCAKDKVICPWCGSEMYLHNRYVGVLQRSMWYGCDNCGGSAPEVHEGGDPYAAAVRRIEQKPLAPSDFHEGDIVWQETRGYSILRPVQIARKNAAYCSFYRIGSEAECGSGMGTYGTTWRCWGIAPNKYEMEESPWYDDY